MNHQNDQNFFLDMKNCFKRLPKEGTTKLLQIFIKVSKKTFSNLFNSKLIVSIVRNCLLFEPFLLQKIILNSFQYQWKNYFALKLLKIFEEKRVDLKSNF